MNQSITIELHNGIETAKFDTIGKIINDQHGHANVIVCKKELVRLSMMLMYWGLNRCDGDKCYGDRRFKVLLNGIVLHPANIGCRLDPDSIALYTYSTPCELCDEVSKLLGRRIDFIAA